MIRSEVGVTLRPAPDGESACATERRRLAFATWLGCVLADGCGFEFRDILCSFSPTQAEFGPYQAQIRRPESSAWRSPA